MVKPDILPILVVEDEPDGQAVVAGLLKASGLSAQAVDSAEEALQMLTEHEYGGVIIDLALPGMDGWELLETIQSSAHTAHLTCVAITAYHSSSVRQQAKTSGFAAYFPKPINQTTFINEIAGYFSA